MGVWQRLVVLSAALVGVVVVVSAVGWTASSTTRTATSKLSGEVRGVVLEGGDGDVRVEGGGPRGEVAIRRVDHFRFGHEPEVSRTVRDGVLLLRARCPRGVLGPCRADWRLTVPENVPVTVRNDDGDVELANVRGPARIATHEGDVRVGAFCGFGLQVDTDAGDVTVAARCAPERLALRSETGDVRATVPAGRYRLDTGGRAADVRGVEAAEDVPFTVQVLSRSGDVALEGRR